MLYEGHRFVLRFYDASKASAGCKNGTGTLSSILESKVVILYTKDISL